MAAARANREMMAEVGRGENSNWKRKSMVQDPLGRRKMLSCVKIQHFDELTEHKYNQVQRKAMPYLKIYSPIMQF